MKGHWWILSGYRDPVFLYQDQEELWFSLAQWEAVGPFASQELAERHRDYAELR